MVLDEDLARNFLASCSGVRVVDIRPYAPRRVTYVHVNASRDDVARLASAPFVTSVEWDCPEQRLRGENECD